MRLRPLLALLSASCLLAACLAACKAECVDKDGDSHGENCHDGPDCDDSDPRLGDRCDAEAKQCAAAPFDPGCPCLVGSHHACFSGAPDVAGTGACVEGTQYCDTGTWTACEDEILPDGESCNAVDDDCDGTIDEGVLSPCGGCNPECHGGVWGPPAAPFTVDGDLALTARGELSLRLHESETRTVFVPNTGEATLSKVDADSAREQARYRTYGDTPERVAVDYNGDAWVLSPSLEGTSWLMRVAGTEDRCVGAGGTGDARPRTSRGPDDILPLGSDDCVLLHVPLGEGGEVARALAIDGVRSGDGLRGGNVWVGLQRSQRMLQLDGISGEVLREVPTPGVSPFDATFDPWGTLWVIDRSGLLARIETASDPAVVEVIEAPLLCFVFDAIASDAAGMLTLTGFSCEDVISYDPYRNRWQSQRTSGVLDTRGVVVLGDDSWVVHTAGRISRVRRDPLSILSTFDLADDDVTPLESIAIGADSLRQLWVVSSMGGADGNGVLSRFDPVAERVTAQVTLGRLPRAVGDITGSRRHGEFAREASAQHVFDGCTEVRDGEEPERFEATEWGALHVVWQAGEGGSVQVAARHAATHAALAGADFVALGTLPADPGPYPLPFEIGGTVEVRLTLRSGARIGAPRVARVGIEWQCPGPD